MNLVAVITRLFLGALLIWSGIFKMKSFLSFADAIRNFQLIGDPWAAGLALWLPWLELVTGIWLMRGKRLLSGALVAALSLIVFTGALMTAWARGLDISCGCFGGTGKIDYPVRLGGNLVLIAMALFLCWKGFTDMMPDRQRHQAEP